MIATESQISIANQLYRARRTLRRLTGDLYASKVLNYMRLIDQHSAGQPGRYLSVAIGLMKRLVDKGEDMGVLWMQAAVVELCEPGEGSPKL